MVNDLHLRYWDQFENCDMDWEIFLMEHKRLIAIYKTKSPALDLDPSIDEYMAKESSENDSLV